MNSTTGFTFDQYDFIVRFNEPIPKKTARGVMVMQKGHAFESCRFKIDNLPEIKNVTKSKTSNCAMAFFSKVALLSIYGN